MLFDRLQKNWGKNCFQCCVSIVLLGNNIDVKQKNSINKKIHFFLGLMYSKFCKQNFATIDVILK